MAYSASEKSLRDGAYAVSFGLLFAIVVQGALEHPHGFYLWQVEFMGAELTTALALLTALIASRRS